MAEEQQKKTGEEEKKKMRCLRTDIAKNVSE